MGGAVEEQRVFEGVFPPRKYLSIETASKHIINIYHVWMASPLPRSLIAVAMEPYSLPL